MKYKMIFCFITIIFALNFTACRKDYNEQARVDIGATVDNNEQVKVDIGTTEYIDSSTNDETNKEDENLKSRVIEEIRLLNHPILEDTPFVSAYIGDICNNNSASLIKSYSEETEMGYLSFFKEDGIIYVCGEPSGSMKNEHKKILGVILTENNKFEFACGVKVGMAEEELPHLELGFEKLTEEDISTEDDDYSYPYVKAISNQFDFEQIYVAKRELSLEEWKEYQCRDSVLTVFVKDGKVIAVSVDNSDELFHEFSITDLFISEHPVLKERIWWWIANWELIEEKCPEEFDIVYSEEGANGHFTYTIGDGITYFSGVWGGAACAIMLTSDKYSFDSGLKVGMTEEELNLINIPFERYAKEEIGVNIGSNMFKEIGPVSMIDFDNLYYFDGICMNVREAQSLLSEIGISVDDYFAPGRTGLIVFLKDGVVKAICTEIPV